MYVPGMEHDVSVIDDQAAARVALMPLRLRILEELSEPASASEVANRLDMPRQKINYHIGVLARHDLIELVGERPRRGFVEKLYRRPEALALAPDLLDRDGVRDHWAKQAAIAAANDVIRSVGSAAGPVPAVAMITDVSFSTPDTLRRFLEEVAGVAARYNVADGGDGVAFRISLLGHPNPNQGDTT